MAKIPSKTEWSRMVRARDGCCKECGTTESLVAHHIKSRAQHPELALDLENGQTLCNACHIEHHKNNPEQTAKSAWAQKYGRMALKKKIKELKQQENQEIQRLNSLIYAVQDRNIVVGIRNKELNQRNRHLMAKVKELEGRLAEYENAYLKMVA